MILITTNSNEIYPYYYFWPKTVITKWYTTALKEEK